MQIIMSNSINLILSRAVLEIVLTVDLVLFKMGQFMSWLLSGHHTVRLFPLVAVSVSVKQLRNVHQTLEDSVTLLS